MKKILMAFIVACITMLSSVAFAYTNPYSYHLNGNPNYILCSAHTGTAWYVDRNSLNVQKYAPPQYIIAVNVVTVDDALRGNTKISYVETYRFFYNIDLLKMYVDDNLNDNWRYLDPKAPWKEIGIAMPAGEIAFALAYNHKFYGNKGIYSDSFYKFNKKIY